MFLFVWMMIQWIKSNFECVSGENFEFSVLFYSIFLFLFSLSFKVQ